MNDTLDKLRNDYEKATLELAKSKEETSGDQIEFHIKLGKALVRAERAKQKLDNYIEGKSNARMYIVAIIVIIGMLLTFLFGDLS